MGAHLLRLLIAAGAAADLAPPHAAGVTQAELLDKLGLVQPPAAGGTGFVEV